MRGDSGENLALLEGAPGLCDIGRPLEKFTAAQHAPMHRRISGVYDPVVPGKCTGHYRGPKKGRSSGDEYSSVREESEVLPLSWVK